MNDTNQYTINRNYYVTFKEIKTLSEYDNITDIVFMNRTPKQDRCYRTLFLNLLYSHLKGYSGVFLSSKKSSYTPFVIINGTKHRSQVYYDGVMQWIKGMEDNGYIIHHKGCNTSKPRRKGWVEITDKFLSEIGEITPEDRERVVEKALKKLIILRDLHTKEEKVFRMDKKQQLIQDFIKRYNDAMNTQVDVLFEGKKVDCDVHRLYLGKVGVYGRFHSNVVNMKKEDRCKITISGERTVEVDYTSSHLAILYAERGVSLSSMKGDPYDILSLLPEDCDMKFLNLCIDTNDELHLGERDVVKIITMIMINTGNVSQAVLAISDKRSDVGKLFNGDRDLINKIISAILEKHSIISEDFFTNKSMDLMTKESNLMLDILVECVAENGIAVLPIHDGVLCKESDSEEVSGIMRAIFNKNFGVIGKVKIK